MSGLRARTIQWPPAGRAWHGGGHVCFGEPHHKHLAENYAFCCLIHFSSCWEVCLLSSDVCFESIGVWGAAGTVNCTLSQKTNAWTPQSLSPSSSLQPSSPTRGQDEVGRVEKGHIPFLSDPQLSCRQSLMLEQVGTKLPQ